LQLYAPWRKNFDAGATALVQPFHRPLFLLTKSEELVANLRLVIERPFTLHRVTDWTQLKTELYSAPSTAVCVADAMVSVGFHSGLAEGIREVAREFPLVAVVACLPLVGQSSDVLAALHSWGIAELLDLHRERTAAAVARRLAACESVWAERLFRRALPRTLSARGRALLETVAHVAASGGHVAELASELGIKSRSVSRWCEAAGVPEARRMFTWIRLLLAAEVLDKPGRTFENVARVTGFASAASLKSTTKVFTGLTPTELRERGAFEIVARLAQSEFRMARESARESRRQSNSWYN
jgi:AraC-like DNA-binding protein